MLFEDGAGEEVRKGFGVGDGQVVSRWRVRVASSPVLSRELEFDVVK